MLFLSRFEGCCMYLSDIFQISQAREIECPFSSMATSPQKSFNACNIRHNNFGRYSYQICILEVFILPHSSFVPNL